MPTSAPIHYDPAAALAAGLAAIALLAWAFWPAKGLWAWWRRLRRAGARVEAEDALKHICLAELEGHEATPQSVAGALQISLGRALEAVERLERSGLVRTDRGRLRLTDPGRRYALQIIRAHRLWESQLAERTGLPEHEWHAQAEAAEHRLSPEDLDRLAAQLGHPTHDPHGDPIPTSDGRLRPPPGKPLTAFEPGGAVRVVHIEDEPESTYAQLVKLGLYPGQSLRIIGKNEREITVRDGRREIRIPRLAAANLTAEAVPCGAVLVS